MEKNKNNKIYIISAICLYIFYFIHGIGASILGQTTANLQVIWNTDAAGILYVITALGMGRLIMYPFSGVISDKFGRKVSIVIGSVAYIAFFALTLVVRNDKLAFAVALLAGVANAFLDSGVIPSVMEIMHKSTGLASILTKLFISMAQSFLPIFLGFLSGRNIYFGTAYIFCIVILIINTIVLLLLPLPKKSDAKQEELKETTTTEKSTPKIKSNFFVEGLALIAIGFTSTATFQIFLNTNKVFGLDILGLSEQAAGLIQTSYANGSIFAVIITAILVKKLIKSVRFLFVYPLISFIAFLTMFFIRTENIANICGFIIGFTAAGGVLQLAVSTMVDLFPLSKGKITSMIMISSSIASTVIPPISGFITKQAGIEYNLIFAASTAIIGVLLSIIVNIRYNALIK